MTNTRVSTRVKAVGTIDLYVMDCPNCATVFGITEDLENRRREDHGSLYCPNGHSMSWPEGKTAKQKLEEAEVRETALRDQLSAAVHDAEAVRVALIRDRQRFANGVCPCCNRSFDNVRRHMSSKHPDYDVTNVSVERARFHVDCSCGRSFETIHGLRIHQSRQRRSGWDTPGASRWSAHLTRV